MKTFDFAIDEEGRLAATVTPTSLGGLIALDDTALRVEYGDPPAFAVTIPRALIARAERAADLQGRTRGVHGRRGSWLVNRSASGLVRIVLRRAVPGRLTPSVLGLPSGGTGLIRRLATWVTRDRTVRVRELTLGVEDPETFLAALG